MPHNVTIHFDDPETKADTAVTATFEDATWETLLQFVDEANKLEATAFVTRKQFVSSTLHVDVKTRTVSYTFNHMPTEDELAAVFHRMRPFILKKNERFEFGRITNYLRNGFHHRYVEDLIDKLKDKFRCLQSQSDNLVNSKEVILNSEKALMGYLNAYEFHRNADVRAQVDEWFKPLPDEYRLFIVVDVVCEKIKAIIAVRDIIKWLNEGAPGKLWRAHP